MSINVPGSEVPDSGGTITTWEVKELTPEQQATKRLLRLGDHGYAAYRPEDFDSTHEPWLVLLADRSVWIQAGPGEPAGGRTPADFACLVDDDLDWQYVVRAAASGRTDAPTSVDDLEQRAKQSQERQQRFDQERRQQLEGWRASATPVSFDDVYPTPGERLTLKVAAERIEAVGGKLEVTKGDRLVVSVSPGARSSDLMRACARLYTAEQLVVDYLKRKRPLPDKTITPAGALLS
jgi:hypothetical protein